MAISRGLQGKNIEDLLSELQTGGQTSGDPVDAEPILDARILPPAGEMFSGKFAAEADWVPIEMGDMPQ